MKAWQLTIGLAVLAIAAGQLPHFVAYDAPPVRARLDRVVGDADYGFVGPEELRAQVETATSFPFVEVEDPQTARAHALQARAVDRLLRSDRSIRACFASPSGALESQIVMHMQILANGRVDEICVTDPATAVGSELANCLSSTIRSMTFPKPADGVPVSVTYPFKR